MDVKGKDKAIPVKALTFPGALRLPDFKTIGT
jgi:hypothetical protein